MKLTVVLAVLIGIILVACSNSAPAPAKPTANYVENTMSQSLGKGLT